MYSHEFDVILNALPMPPVASTTAFAPNSDELAALAPVADGAGDAVAVLEQARDRALHEHVDAVVHRVLLERADHLEAGAVADVREARVAVAAEVALEDAALLRAVEERAPAFELVDAVRRFLGVELGHAPVVEHLAAAHRVAEVDLPVVLGVDVAQRRGDAALGHDGVRLAEQRLADQRRLRALGRSLDGRAQPGAARADDDHVVLVTFVFGH